MPRIRRELYNKEICACSIFGAMNQSGERFNGAGVMKAIANMHVRGNGLGGGFAAYGIYPEYKDYYAFHLMFTGKSRQDKLSAKAELEEFLAGKFDVVYDEEIPHRDESTVSDPPLVWRYFLLPHKHGEDEAISDEDYIVSKVMWVNTKIENAYVFSSGKNMGCFKGVGYPEEIGEYFMLDKLYQAYTWTVHGRFPTNTQAWWGGAHPFSLLDTTIVHNGEISSYGTNRWYLEMYGYACTLQTDTEVIAYAADLLMRRQRLPIEIVAKDPGPSDMECHRQDERLGEEAAHNFEDGLWASAHERAFCHNHRPDREDDWPHGQDKAAAAHSSQARGYVLPLLGRSINQTDLARA